MMNSTWIRSNRSSKAWFDGKLWAEGTFKNVFLGKYTEGPRKGQHCVAKLFKTGSVYGHYYFDEELNIVKRTQRIIDDFQARKIINQNVMLNIPEVWEFCPTGENMMVEPKIAGFEKFNSNSGWVANMGTITSDAMQALSHFSYHNSYERYLLCDLQGGVYRDGFILTDPVIMSQAQDCGPGDLGPAGIDNWFQGHTCGRFCKPYWDKPKSTGRTTIQKQWGTMMAPCLPTRYSRAPISNMPSKLGTGSSSSSRSPAGTSSSRGRDGKLEEIMKRFRGTKEA